MMHMAYTWCIILHKMYHFAQNVAFTRWERRRCLADDFDEPLEEMREYNVPWVW